MKYAFQIGEKTAEVNCHDNLTIEELEVAKEMLSKMALFMTAVSG